MSPIFSPNILEWELSVFRSGTIQTGLMRQILVLWIHLVFAALAITCEEYTTRTFASPSARWVDEPEINKKLDTKVKSEYSSSINHTAIFYAAMIIIAIKWWDVTHTLTFEGGQYGVSVGTFSVMAIEAFVDHVCYLMSRIEASCWQHA